MLFDWHSFDTVFNIPLVPVIPLAIITVYTYWRAYWIQKMRVIDFHHFQMLGKTVKFWNWSLSVSSLPAIHLVYYTICIFSAMIRKYTTEKRWNELASLCLYYQSLKKSMHSFCHDSTGITAVVTSTILGR